MLRPSISYIQKPEQLETRRLHRDEEIDGERERPERACESINRCYRDYLWLGKIEIRSAYVLSMTLMFFMRTRCCDSVASTLQNVDEFIQIDHFHQLII